MHPKAPKHLDDIRDAAGFIQKMAADKSPDDYKDDRVLRPVVERNFEIIGEAVNRLRRDDPPTAARIGDAVNIVAFRNALIHGYNVIDDDRVWKTISEDIPTLRRDVEAILREAADAE